MARTSVKPEDRFKRFTTSQLEAELRRRKNAPFRPHPPPRPSRKPRPSS